VSLKRYLTENGLNIAQQEIESTQGLSLPLSPYWLKRKETILERYSQKQANFSTIVITVRNKAIADRAIAHGLFFGGFNHKVDRFWEIGPTEICPKCCEFGHTAYKACKNTPRCYICAGGHEAIEHQCSIIGCNARIGKPCIHLPLKCTHCKGAHLATSISCPQRKKAIAIAKEKKGRKDKKVEIIVPKKTIDQAIYPSSPLQTSTSALPSSPPLLEAIELVSTPPSSPPIGEAMEGVEEKW
jgi:hypothetical protein